MGTGSARLAIGVAGVLLLWFAVALSAHAADRRAERIAWLQANLPELMRTHRVPGASVVLLQRGAPDFAAAWGVRDARTGEPVTPDTVFEACSLSKPVFALLALQSVQQGRLALDTPLVDYLGHDYPHAAPAHRSITARMVLEHRSGFPNWREGDEHAAPLPVLFAPGTQYGYSGEGYLFLQRALEASAGEPLEVLAGHALFAPLGLRHTAFAWSAEIERDLASGHDAEGAFKQRSHYTEANAAYTLYTTPGEYARLVSTLLRPAVLGRQAFTVDSIALMLARQSPLEAPELFARPPAAQGTAAYRTLGWSLEAGPAGDILQHTGSNSTGFKTFVQFSPAHGSVLVLFMNGDGGGAVRDAVVAAIGDP